MKKLLLLFSFLSCLLAKADVVTWKSNPTSATEWDAALEGSSSNTSEAPTGWWIDKTAVTNWDLALEWEGSTKYYSRGKTGVTFGAGSNRAIYKLELTTSDFPGEITNVKLTGVKTNGSAKILVRVGNTDFMCGNEYTPSLSSTSTDYSFEGSGSGQIYLCITQSTKSKYVSFTGLEVTYADKVTTLGDIVVKKGEEVIGEDNYCALEQGESLSFSCANAESIEVVSYETSEAVELTEVDGVYTYTPGVVASDILEVTAKLGEESKTREIEITVIAVVKVPTPVITLAGEKDENGNYYYGATATVTFSEEVMGFMYTIDGTDPLESETAETVMYTEEPAQIDLNTSGDVVIKIVVFDVEANQGKVVEYPVKLVKYAPEIEWPVTTFNATMGADNEFPVLVNPNDLKISYHSSDEAVATIDKATGAIELVGSGSSKIRATYTTTADSKFSGSWKEYTLTVIDPNNVSYETSYTFDFTIDNNYGLEATTDGDDYAAKTTKQIFRKDIILTIDPTDVSGNQTYRQWHGTTTDLRMWNSVKLIVAVPEDGEIKSVKFVKGAGSDFYMKAGSTTLSKYNSNESTYTPAEATNVVEFEATGKAFFGKLEVTYDVNRPAQPHVVSESATQIVIACDDTHELHYIKTAQQAKATPSRVAMANDDSDAWTKHTDTQLVIDLTNEDHKARDYSFKAVHPVTGVESTPLMVAVSSEGTLTGIENVAAEIDVNAPVEYYDLQGRRIANPTRGLVIRRQGTKVEKIIL